MITTQLLRPESIVVVGASNNVHKPGGAILKNLINGGYQGELRAVNPKEKEVQGVPAFADVNDLPDTDLAVLAVPASMCPDIVETLASKKQTRAFIILSAGFGEETHEGALLEERILETVNKMCIRDSPYLFSHQAAFEEAEYAGLHLPQQFVVGNPVEREDIYKDARMHRDVLEHFFYEKGVVFLNLRVVIGGVRVCLYP